MQAPAINQNQNNNHVSSFAVAVPAGNFEDDNSVMGGAAARIVSTVQQTAGTAITGALGALLVKGGDALLARMHDTAPTFMPLGHMVASGAALGAIIGAGLSVLTNCMTADTRNPHH